MPAEELGTFGDMAQRITFPLCYAVWLFLGRCE